MPSPGVQVPFASPTRRGSAQSGSRRRLKRSRSSARSRRRMPQAAVMTMVLHRTNLPRRARQSRLVRAPSRRPRRRRQRRRVRASTVPRRRAPLPAGAAAARVRDVASPGSSQVRAAPWAQAPQGVWRWWTRTMQRGAMLTSASATRRSMRSLAPRPSSSGARITSRCVLVAHLSPARTVMLLSPAWLGVAAAPPRLRPSRRSRALRTRHAVYTAGERGRVLRVLQGERRVQRVGVLC